MTARQVLRRFHSLIGISLAAGFVAIALTGVILSLAPAWDKAGSLKESSGLTVAQAAAAAFATHPDAERLVRTPAGALLVYPATVAGAAADVVDPRNGRTVGPYRPSATLQMVTELHRSLLLAAPGRAATGLFALTMMAMTISGAFMLARRAGGWRALLRKQKGDPRQRLHAGLGRIAVVGLMFSASTGLYMSLATFDLVAKGEAAGPAFPDLSEEGPRLSAARVPALAAIKLKNLRELDFPRPDDPGDLFAVVTDDGMGYISPISGRLVAYRANGFGQRLYQAIYALHTGQGLWAIGLLEGLAAACVPALAWSGLGIWRRRRKLARSASPRGDAPTADTIILVGSEGHGTWRFAESLRAALAAAGHRVHLAPMNALATTYPGARRMIVMTATYGDGAAPMSARQFLARLSAARDAIPVAVLGFGDRGFPRFNRYARDVAKALEAKGWPTLIEPEYIDRQSEQAFAAWCAKLERALGERLAVTHEAVRPKTLALQLTRRTDYGDSMQARTSILRFAPAPDEAGKSAARIPRHAVGDLLAVLPPGVLAARYYSLASSSKDAFLEICVRKIPGGLCSGYLHDLAPGQNIDAFIRENAAFRPSRGRSPLILVGAGAGIGPLAGFIRHNHGRRPVELYWGGRDPASDFLYRDDLARWLADQRLTRLTTAFSRAAAGAYVQDKLAQDADRLRRAVAQGGQVLVCGSRVMAQAVANVWREILRPDRLDLQTLRGKGLYLEDVY